MAASGSPCGGVDVCVHVYVDICVDGVERDTTLALNPKSDLAFYPRLLASNRGWSLTGVETWLWGSWLLSLSD